MSILEEPVKVAAVTDAAARKARKAAA